MNEKELIFIEINDEWDEDIKEKISTINEATSIQQQIKDFKKLSEIKIQNKELIKLIADLYFTLQVKNPIKNCIQKVFDGTCIEESTKIISKVIEKEIDIENPHFIDCLNESSQNFKLLLKTIGKNPKNVINFLIRILQHLYVDLKAGPSPLERNKIGIRLHAVIQAIMSCLKSHLNEIEKDDFQISEEFKIINEICMDLLCLSDISLDIRNNCGMLIVLRSNLVGDDFYMEIIRDSTNFCMKRLCLISGVLLAQDVDIQLLNEICVILKELTLIKSVDPQVVIATSRLMMQISKKSLDSKIINNEIASIILEYAFSNIEHNIDVVKILSKNSLKHLLENDQLDVQNMVFKKIKDITSIMSKASIIQSIIGSISVKKIISVLPDFQISLLCALNKNKENIFTCYELMSKKYYQENSFEEWYSKIIQPIINHMKVVNEDSQNELRQLLSSCIKQSDPEAVKKILLLRNEFDTKFVLLCLNVAKKSGLLDPSLSTSSTWRGVITYDEIKNFIVNFDDEIQFSVLSLLVDSRKANEAFNDDELTCIFYFYESNINIQNPTIRQSIITTTKKLFERLHNLCQLYQRKNNEKEMAKIFEILIKFQEFAINNITGESNHSRRILSLKMLLNNLEVMKSNFPSKEISSLWSKVKFDVILSVFYDDFEANKQIALEIMSYIPRDIVISFSELSLEYLERLMTSIKISDSLAAAYLLQFAINFSLFEYSHATNVVETTSDIYPSTYDMLIWCEDILLKALNIAKKSIIVSSGSFTIYGPLLAIRYITAKLDFNALKYCPLWREYLGRIVKICRQLTEVVAKIVNNSSPEGNFPEEEQEDENIEEHGEEELRIINNTTSQMILINAWRTIKEVSLFLGDLSLRCSSIGSILSTNEMLEIADHLLVLMTKTKHRGAFEQAFYGFSQFAIALRLSSVAELHNLPLKILENLITSISGENEKENDDDEQEGLILGFEMKNLCVTTRRSAGLPFIVQALIISEQKIATNYNFHFVMVNLLKYARNGNQLETRVHSLNILRALFRCKELNEDIMVYVGDAMECSLLAYDAEAWSERNSSTLLFSALMIRVFGPQRTKNNEELSIRNKMSAKLFFQRFKLHSFITELLHRAEQRVKSQKKNAKLHPLLLLLNRLFSSNNEDENSIKLTEFIPIIASCSGCVELQTRILCAKFIANNMTSNCVTKTIFSDIKSCRDEKLTANAKHGKLLTILYLCKQRQQRECITEGESLRILDEVFDLFHRFKNQVIIMNAVLDILIECLICTTTVKSINFDSMNLNAIASASSKAYGYPLLCKKILALKLIKMKVDENLEELFKFNNLNFYETQEKLNCLLLILDYDYAINIMDEYELDTKICELTQKISSNESLRKKIKENLELKTEVKNLINSKDYNIAVRSFEVLSYLKYTKGECTLSQVKEFVESTIKQPDDMCRAKLKYAKTCLLADKNYLSSIEWEILSGAIESSFFIKLSTLDLLEILAINTPSITSVKTLHFLTKAMLNFLMDDDIDIRLKSSKIVSMISNHKDIYIATYAQSIFLNHMEKSSYDKNNFLMAVKLLIQELTQNCNEEENEEEFQVFEHNESNTFKEKFLIEEICMSFMKERE